MPAHVGQTQLMSSGCYACRQSGPEAPFRERFVREAGWRVAHDFNSSLEGWLILAPLRHVHALDELTALMRRSHSAISFGRPRSR